MRSPLFFTLLYPAGSYNEIIGICLIRHSKLSRFGLPTTLEGEVGNSRNYTHHQHSFLEANRRFPGKLLNRYGVGVNQVNVYQFHYWTRKFHLEHRAEPGLRCRHAYRRLEPQVDRCVASNSPIMIHYAPPYRWYASINSAHVLSMENLLATHSRLNLPRRRRSTFDRMMSRISLVRADLDVG